MSDIPPEVVRRGIEYWGAQVAKSPNSRVIELSSFEIDLLLKVLTLARNAGWGSVKYSPKQIDPLRRRLRALLGDSYEPTI